MRSHTRTWIREDRPVAATASRAASPSRPRLRPMITSAPASTCMRAIATVSSTWSPAITLPVCPLASTVRRVGQLTHVLRLSSRNRMPCVTSKSWLLKATDSSLPRNTIVCAMSLGSGKVLARASPFTLHSSVMCCKNLSAVAPGSAPCSWSRVANTLRMRALRSQ